MTALLPNDPLPLYAQLAATLRRRLAGGDWPDGQTLPSLPALMAEFSVARVTARQAISLLQQEGLVATRRGRGTVVTGRPAAPHLQVHASFAGLVEMLRDQRTGVRTLSEGTEAPALTPEDGIAAPGYVSMRRVHLRDGAPYCVIALHLDARVFRRAPQRFREQAILPVLASLASVRIARARQSLVISVADADTASHLRLAPGAPVVEVRRVLRSAEGIVIYHGDVVYRADEVRLDMELAL